MTVEQHCQQKHLLRSKLSQPIVTINDIKPVKLHISHKRKFKKLYSLFAIDVVGNKEVMGPFQQPPVLERPGDTNLCRLVEEINKDYARKEYNSWREKRHMETWRWRNQDTTTHHH